MSEHSEAMEDFAVREAPQGYLPVVAPAAQDDVPTGYKRTEVGVIPKDWDVRLLGSGVSLYSGHHVLAQHCNTSGVGAPYLTGPADFPNGFIKQTKYTVKPSVVCEGGDILITVKGSGAGALIEADRQYCISRQLMAIRVVEWDPRFVYFSLLENSSSISDAVSGLIPGLSRGDILSQLIPVPILPEEQSAIATALSDANALIDSLDRLIAKKGAIKQAAMQQLLTGQTRLPGFTGKWESKELGQIGIFYKGQGIRRDDVTDEGVACIRYGEIYTRYEDCVVEPESYISDAIAQTAFPLIYGDLLFAGSGETAEEIGMCVAYIGQQPAYAGGDIVVLRPTQGDPAYLGRLLNHPSIAQQKARLGQGDAVVHISARNLARIELHLPPKEEQTAIATVLSDMDAEIEALERRRDKARQIKQGMMQQLLTGRVRLVRPEAAL